MNKAQILKKLLEILTKYLKIDVNFGKNYEKDRFLFRGLCNQCLSLDGIDEQFYSLQNQLLQLELKEENTVNVNSFEYKNTIALFKGDITTIKADAIVNAGNDEFLGCFVPCHSCIDNVIMSASGFQMRNELVELKKRADYNNMKVKVTKGYNLPCKYVFHVAGPQIFGAVQNQDKQALRDCYINCLNEAKAMKLKSIVFCCISTGLYSFPNQLACEIAVKAVKD